MPRPPLLSTAQIVAAALAVIDADGLEQLSMRRLATELGVRAGSLYRHVKTKDDLLHEAANEIMKQVDVSGFEAGWPVGLRTWARSLRAALAAHPNIVPFLAHGPADREVSLRHADRVHAGLTGCGWPPRYATMIGASIKYLVLGSAMASFAAGFPDQPDVYRSRFPSLHQAHLLREHAGEIDAESFELALDALLAGLAQLRERLPVQ
jgi:AcrR family transcriptional regulator